MRNRGISLIKSIVVIGIIVVLAITIIALLIPNFIMGSHTYKPRDVYNLKGLVGIFISAQTDKKTAPKSTGHRFWLAMFVGDPVGVEGGLKIEDVYASPSQAGNLLSPKDAEAFSKDEISQAFENALTYEIQGWD